MDFGWLWQGLFSNLLSAAIVAGMAAMLGFLRLKDLKKDSHWASVLLYAFLGAVLMAGFILIINVRYKIVTEQKAITSTENIQERVRIWLDNFQLPSQSKPDNITYFKYALTLPNGNNITVFRLKDKEGYVFLSARLILEPHIDKLSKIQREELISQMTIEVARQRMEFSTLTKKDILLVKRIPITAGLTEDAFIGGINDIDCMMLLLRQLYITTLKHNKVLIQ